MASCPFPWSQPHVIEVAQKERPNAEVNLLRRPPRRAKLFDNCFSAMAPSSQYGIIGSLDPTSTIVPCVIVSKVLEDTMNLFIFTRNGPAFPPAANRDDHLVFRGSFSFSFRRNRKLNPEPRRPLIHLKNIDKSIGRPTEDVSKVCFLTSYRG